MDVAVLNAGIGEKEVGRGWGRKWWEGWEEVGRGLGRSNRGRDSGAGGREGLGEEGVGSG